jgi:hypothetical protein
MPIPTSRPEGVAKPPAALTNQPGTPSQPGTAPGPSANAAPAANLPHSLLDKPAAAPRVTLNGGSLAVDANNSSLSEILKDLETSSGMTVDGFEKDTRVFGIYGPGPPRDVISSLLEGAGYNFLMVGVTEAGTPREVLLTARSNAPISAPQPSSQPEEDDEPIAPPPVEAPPVQPPPPATQPRQPRTPQEMLQELQQIRQQQQQQPGATPPATTPQ